jgi:hypothetical protein
VFSAAITSSAKERASSKALIDFLRTPDAAAQAAVRLLVASIAAAGSK